jgi:DNA-binding Lrp family transcriptional regulator
MLDQKDKKILYELELDSRQSLSQLGKKTLLKKETLFHRIKNLEKEIIHSYITEINIYKLGYIYYPILIKLSNITKTKEEKLISYLKNHPQTAWLTICEGNWNINLTLVSKSISEIKEFLNGLEEKFGKYIPEKNIFITSEITYLKKAFSLNKEKQQVTFKSETPSVITDKELKLLRILSTNARMPLIEISKKLQTSPKNIAYSIKKLEKQKIITGSRIQTSFPETKYYKIWISTKENPELIKFLRTQEQIIWITKLIGKYDLSIELEITKEQELLDIINKIKTFKIKNYEIIQIFTEIKIKYF